MNHIVLIGRLTRDPELRYTPNGTAVANFDLAVERPVPNQAGEKEADFIRIIAWKKVAENCANYLSKGRLVAIEGRLQIRSYEDANGQKRRVAEVIANNVQFLERGKSGSENKPEPEPDSRSNPLDDINLDDLPF